jgi:replicative DNA helicase
VTATIIPYNEEAEQSVLGSMLLYRDDLRWGAEFLRGEDFHVLTNRLLFGALSDLAAADKPATYVTVMDVARAKGLPVTYQTLIGLTGGEVGVEGIQYHAAILKDLTLRRRMLDQARETSALLQKRDASASETLERIQSAWASLETDDLRDSLRPLKEVMANTYESMERQSQEVKSERFNTGLTSWDTITGGIQQGAFYVIGARTGMGKTTLAVNWLTHLAFRERIPVALFSLEMGARAIGQKIMAAEGGVSAFRLRMANLQEDHWMKIQNAAAKAYNAPFYVDDSRSQSVVQITTKARRAARQYGVRCVAVDYFQLLSLGARAESARLAYVECSHQLQALAGDANIAVILLSQLGRSAEMRPDRRPQREDLKETGSLEEDADVVTLLHHPQGKAQRGVVELLIEKNRLGESHRVARAWWEPEVQRFRNLESGEDFQEPKQSPRKDGPYAD